MAIFGKCGLCTHCSQVGSTEALKKAIDEKNIDEKQKEYQKHQVDNNANCTCLKTNQPVRRSYQCKCGQFEMDSNKASAQEYARFLKLKALDNEGKTSPNQLGQPKQRPQGTFLDKVVAMFSKDVREAATEKEYPLESFEKIVKGIEDVMSHGGASHPTYYTFTKNVHLNKGDEHFFRFGVGGFYNPIAGEVIVEAVVAKEDKTYVYLSATSEGKFDCLKFLEKNVLGKLDKLS